MVQFQPNFFSFNSKFIGDSKSNILVFLKCLSEPLKPNFIVYGLISTKCFSFNWKSFTWNNCLIIIHFGIMILEFCFNECCHCFHTKKPSIHRVLKILVWLPDFIYDIYSAWIYYILCDSLVTCITHNDCCLLNYDM